MAEWIPLVYWSLVAALLFLYLLLAALRRNVSLRPTRLAIFAGVVLCGQAVLWLGGTGAATWQWCAAGTALAVVAAGWPLGRRWVISAPLDDLHGRIAQACSGLLLDYQETPEGNLVLSHRSVSCTLRIGRLGRRHAWIILPSTTEKNKISLLNDWLKKQFPGPIPRLRIQLNKERR